MKAVLLLALAALLIGCTGEAKHDVLTPDVIMVGVLPDQSAEQLVEKYTPLVDYLVDQTSLDIELVVPKDYESMLDDFSSHRVHVANFGGFTFTEAEHRDNAEPLVMRDVDLRFTSCYLVSSADTRNTIEEFQGESFSFGPRLSTSGHLMPRYFLEAQGLNPDTFFASVRHSSGHDETATLVRNGDIVVGVANCVIVESMFLDGRLGQGEVRILETTPAYADYVWAVNEELDPAIKTRLRDAFMDLDPTLPEHQEILRSLGAHAYLPASRSDLDEVRRAVRTNNDSGTLNDE